MNACVRACLCVSGVLACACHTHHFVGLPVDGLPYCAVRAIPQGLHNLEPAAPLPCRVLLRCCCCLLLRGQPTSPQTLPSLMRLGLGAAGGRGALRTVNCAERVLRAPTRSPQNVAGQLEGAQAKHTQACTPFGACMNETSACRSERTRTRPRVPCLRARPSPPFAVQQSTVLRCGWVCCWSTHLFIRPRGRGLPRPLLAGQAQHSSLPKLLPQLPLALLNVSYLCSLLRAAAGMSGANAVCARYAHTPLVPLGHGAH